MSDFDEYQTKAFGSAVYPDQGQGTMLAVNYTSIGLAGESGELLNKLKKVWRGDKPLVDQREAMLDEAGDVLWYLAALCTEFGYSLHDLALRNLDKVQKRRAEGKTRGDGDKR